jgi:hypothetical protein
VSAATPALQLAREEFRRGWLGARARRLRWRVALALLASLAIHLATLAGLGMPEIEHVERSEGQPLAARIAPLPLVMAPETIAAPAPPSRAAAPRPKRKTKPVTEAVAQLSTPLPAEAAAPVAAPPAETEAGSEPPAQVPAEAAKPEPAASVQPADTPIAFPERIELEFDIAKSADHAPMGRVVHRFEREGARYVIQSVSAATGIAVLFATGRYVQESRGTLTPQGLRPDQFVVRRGRAERTETAAFDWTSARATVSAGGATKEWTLQAGAQDQLSYLHQLSFLIADPSLPAVMVTNGRKFFSASLEIVGRETVATGLGPISALQVRSRLEGESRMDVWLAPDYGNLPVKVRIRDSRGEEFEQVLAAMRVQ